MYEDGKTEKVILPKGLLRSLILKELGALLSSNIIGPPSVTIYRNDKKIFYDRKLQWLVDIDFYIRYLKNSKFCYINQSLLI